VTDPTTSGARKWLLFAAVATSLFLVGIDQTIVASALIAIGHELGVGIEWASWTITVYALAQVVVLPLAGRLGEFIGRKPLFIGAVLLFAVASACCAFAGDIQTLIAFRILQAIGGGAFIPSASGLVADHFGPGRDRAIGMFSSIYPIGAIVGPLVGGIVVATGWWRGVFLVSVPLSLVVVIVAICVLPGSVRGAREPIDVLGLILFVCTLLSAMVGIALLGDAGTSITDPLVAGCAATAVLSLLLFVLRLRSARHPFIPPALLIGRGFGVMNVFNLLYGAAALGFVTLIPLYAQLRFGLDPLSAGSLMISRAVGTILVAALSTMLLRRTGYRLPIAIGSVVTALGLLGLAWVPAGQAPYSWLFLAGGIAGVGIGFAVPAANNATLNLAPQRVGAIVGLRAMFRQSGAIASVSVATALAARSTDPEGALAVVFVALAGFMLILVLLLTRISDHKGRW
jgi:EmrB/QacA subfamily drug resistance transporter